MEMTTSSQFSNSEPIHNDKFQGEDLVSLETVQQQPRVTWTAGSPKTGTISYPRQLKIHFYFNPITSAILLNYVSTILTFLSFNSVKISSIKSLVSTKIVLYPIYSSIFSLANITIISLIPLFMYSVTCQRRSSLREGLMQQVAQRRDWQRLARRHSLKNQKDSLAMSSCFNGSQLSQPPGYQNCAPSYAATILVFPSLLTGSLGAQRMTLYPLLTNSKAVIMALTPPPITATSLILVASWRTVIILLQIYAEPQDRESQASPCPQLWNICLSPMFYCSSRKPPSRQMWVYWVAEAGLPGRNVGRERGYLRGCMVVQSNLFRHYDYYSQDPYIMSV